MSMIQVKNVSCRFGSTLALKNISLTFESGKIYGLLGRNGAGKTTLLNIITNKVFATAGEILIDGESGVENDRAQAKIYCMTEKNVHPRMMRVKDGFNWARQFNPGFSLEYADLLSRRFNLDTRKRIKSLSSGYSSIFKLILALASAHPVIILDEPVLGLDAAYRELITSYGENPRTVIIATHLIDEVAEVLEEVVILKNGELVMSEPVESLLNIAYSVSGEASAVNRYAQGKKVIREETFGKHKVATVFQKREAGDKTIIHDFGLELIPARLQEIFISLTESKEGEK